MIDCSKTKNYLSAKARMTKKHKLNGGAYLYGLTCAKCPLSSLNNGTTDSMSCSDFETFYPEKAIEVVQRWSDEHPQKTFLTEFLKNYPNAPLVDDETPKCVCLRALGLMDIDNCDDNCVKCWNQPIKDGEE